MSVKSTKRKKQKRNTRNQQRLARDLHFINQHEEVIAEQMGIYEWGGW